MRPLTAARARRRGGGAPRRWRAGRLCMSSLAALLAGVSPGPARAEEEASALLARVQRTVPSLARVYERDARSPLEGRWRNAVIVDASGQLLLAGDPPLPGAVLTVTLPDGRELPGQVMGGDLRTQLTLVRVDAEGLTPLVLRPAEEVRAEQVPDPLAPPPLGLALLLVTSERAVARGVLRGSERHLGVRDLQNLSVEVSVGLLEAALATLPEDAGAPWLDAQGRLVALQVEAGSRQDADLEAHAQAHGLRLRVEPTRALGVPAAVIRLVWPLLERFGRVPRAGLGVQSRPVDDALRAHVCGSCGGHVLEELDAQGSAAGSGVEPLDVLVSVNGVTVPPGRTLHDVLLPHRPQSRALLGLVRAGRRLEVPVLLGDL